MNTPDDAPANATDDLKVGDIFESKVKLLQVLSKLSIVQSVSVTARSRVYGDITATYIHRANVPSHIYVTSVHLEIRIQKYVVYDIF